MGSIKDFKKEINYIFGEVIDEAFFKKLMKPEVEDAKIEAIVDEAVDAYDNFKDKINQGKKAEDKKSFFKTLNKEYVDSVNALLDKIKKL